MTGYTVLVHLISQERTATDLIKEHLDRLHALVEALLDHEVVSGEEVEAIMQGPESSRN